MKKVLFYLTLPLTYLMFFAGTSYAQDPIAIPDQPDVVIGLLGELGKAASGGQWGLVIVLSLVVCVGILRWLSTKISKLSFLTNRWGGWALVLVGTSSGVIAGAFLAGQAVSWGLVSSALTIGLAAAGTKELFKDVGKKKE